LQAKNNTRKSRFFVSFPSLHFNRVSTSLGGLECPPICIGHVETVLINIWCRCSLWDQKSRVAINAKKLI
jgi:hypothetical protein